MGRGPGLNEQEKQEICRLLMEKKELKEIATTLGRSLNIIKHYVVPTRKRGRPRKLGRPRKTTEREDRWLVRKASNQCISCAQLASDLGGKISKETVRKRLHDVPYLKRQKMLSRPRLTKPQVDQRITWVTNHMASLQEWRWIIPSDEKRFSVEGPDGWHSYWHDLRKEQVYYAKDKFAKGICVWGAVSFDGKASLGFSRTTIDSGIYQRIVEENLLPFLSGPRRDKFVFFQDQASPHTSNSTVSFFAANNIRFINFPANSPDLNIIENLWSLMVRAVYSGNRRFDSVEELTAAILTAWEEIPQDTIRNLYQSIPHRLAAVLLARGHTTNY